jgi:hypothetical protein
MQARFIKNLITLALLLSSLMRMISERAILTVLRHARFVGRRVRRRALRPLPGQGGREDPPTNPTGPLDFRSDRFAAAGWQVSQRHEAAIPFLAPIRTLGAQVRILGLTGRFNRLFGVVSCPSIQPCGERRGHKGTGVKSAARSSQSQCAQRRVGCTGGPGVLPIQRLCTPIRIILGDSRKTERLPRCGRRRPSCPGRHP